MKTAIQKAIEDLEGYKTFTSIIDVDFAVALLNTYVKMEKQQIIDAAERWKGTDFAEKYYAETYGSKGSDETNSEKPNETSSQTEHNSPKVENKTSFGEISDEEIEEASENAWSDYEYEEGNLYSTTFKGGWKLAIKWYREQLKQRQ